MKLYSTIVFLLIFIVNVKSQENTDLKQAEGFYNNQDYAAAFKAYNQCIIKDSTNILCLEKAGNSAYRLGDIASARKLYILLEKQDSSHRTALSQLATIYDQNKNTPKAIKYYNELIKLYPDNSIYYRKVADQFKSAGLKTDAFKNYAKAYEINERDLLSIKGLSEILISNQQFAEADSLLIEGLLLDSLNVSLHLLLAQSCYRQKDYENTVSYLKKLQGRFDLTPYYNKMFGYSYIQIDSFEKAIPILHLALVDEGTKEYAHYYLATAYFELDSIDFAKHHYEEALKEGISANVDLYHRVLAKINNEQNQLSSAIEHYKDAYKYGKDPLMLFYLARASDTYYKDKNIAVNYYNRYVKSSDTNEEYKDYAKKRSRHLKEIMHQKSH